MPKALIRAAGLLALALAPAALSGCGPCAQVAAHRDAFAARTVPEAGRPHLAVRIPQKLLDDAIAAGLRKLVPKSLAIPGLGQLARYVEALKIAPRRVAIAKAGDGQFRLSMELEVGLGAQSLFTLGLGTETRPVANAGAGAVELSFPADMIQSLTPSVPDGAVTRLTDALMGKVPSALRSIIPRAEVTRIAESAVGWLSQNAVRLLRTEVLQPMGELARLRFTMPDLPLASLELVSEPGALVVQARTTLPVEQGLAPMPRAESLKRAQSAAQSDRIEVVLAAGTVVELANWAMARGEVPSRFDVQGKSNDAGSFTAGLQWAGGTRPLKVNVWSSEGACIRARIGASPRVALANGKLDLGISDAQVEEIEGPPLVSQAVSWAQSLWGDSVETSRTRVGTSKLGLGTDKAGGLGLGRIALEGDTLVLSLNLGGKPSAAAPLPATPGPSVLAPGAVASGRTLHRPRAGVETCGVAALQE